MIRTLTALTLLSLAPGCQSCGERPGFFRRLFHGDDDCPSNRAAARPACATPAGYLGSPTPPPGSVPVCTPVSFDPNPYQGPYQGGIQPLPGPSPSRADELPQPGGRLPSQNLPLTPGGSATPRPANPNDPGGL